MALPMTSEIEPASGDRCLVLPGDLNECNTFWEGYIGKSGHVVKLSADGMITVVMDDGNVCEGIKPARFSFSPGEAKPLDADARAMPWWRRMNRLWTEANAIRRSAADDLESFKRAGYHFTRDEALYFLEWHKPKPFSNFWWARVLSPFWLFILKQRLKRILFFWRK